MGKITWNTDVNTPGCPGEIIGDNARTLLIQQDTDYPSVASSFGWSLRRVQKCPCCLGAVTDFATKGLVPCPGNGRVRFEPCRHSGTDGTVDCPDCNCKAGDFIAVAGGWLLDNNGVEADDPGYFDELPEGGGN